MLRAFWVSMVFSGLGSGLALPARAQTIVTLANGREHLVDRIEREASTLILHFAQGSLRVAASEVLSTEELGAGNAPYREFSNVTFRLTETAFETRIPADYRAVEPQPEPSVVTFAPRTGSGSLRFAWAAGSSAFWTVPAVVHQHHRASYAEYQVVAERFTQLGEALAWMTTFRYRRGATSWVECQGFLDLGDLGVLVISATSPIEPDEEALQWLVGSVGRSLRVRLD